MASAACATNGHDPSDTGNNQCATSWCRRSECADTHKCESHSVRNWCRHESDGTKSRCPKSRWKLELCCNCQTGPWAADPDSAGCRPTCYPACYSSRNAWRDCREPNIHRRHRSERERRTNGKFTSIECRRTLVRSKQLGHGHCPRSQPTRWRTTVFHAARCNGPNRPDGHIPSADQHSRTSVHHHTDTYRTRPSHHSIPRQFAPTSSTAAAGRQQQQQLSANDAVDFIELEPAEFSEHSGKRQYSASCSPPRSAAGKRKQRQRTKHCACGSATATHEEAAPSTRRCWCRFAFTKEPAEAVATVGIECEEH